MSLYCVILILGGLSAGFPPFVVQEEFDRYVGYWWRPTMTNGNMICLFLIYQKGLQNACDLQYWYSDYYMLYSDILLDE